MQQVALDAASDAVLLSQLYGRLEVETKDRKRELADWVDLPPEEAIAFFKAKRIVSADQFKRLEDSAKREAFSIAGLHRRYALEQAHGVLAEAIETGEAKRATVKRLREVMDGAGLTRTSKHHLDTVFRTNVLGSYAEGRYRQAQAVKRSRPFWRYTTVGDGRVRPAHREMDGHIARADDPIWDQWLPPNGFNSILPTQRVSCAAVMGLKAFYAGPAIEVIGKSGGRFAVTAQHPILTRDGWVEAQHLRQGNQLVAYRRDIRLGAMPADLDKYDPPPTIEQAFNSFNPAVGCSVPRAAVHLNGDVQFIHGDVDVVAVDRQLLDDANAALSEVLDELALSLPLPSRRVSAANDRASRAVDGHLRGSLRGMGGQSRETLRAILAPHRLSAIGGNPAASKESRDLLRALPQLASDVFQRHATEIHIDGLWWDRFSRRQARLSAPLSSAKTRALRFGAYGNSAFLNIFVGSFGVNADAARDIIDGQAGLVQLDDVADLRRFDYCGHVYDLQTNSGTILAYGGAHAPHYVVSNCRCSIETLSQADVTEQGLELSPPVPPSRRPDTGFAGSPRIADRQKRAQAKLRREADRMRVLRPPTPSTTGRRAYSSSGDMGWSTSLRRASVVDELAGVSRQRAAELVSDGAVNIVAGREARLRRGLVRFQLTMPSQHLDGLEQLVARIAADPRTAKLTDQLKYRPVARYIPGEAPRRFSAAVVRDGFTRATSVQLQVDTGDLAAVEALAEILIGAEQGSGAAVRYAAEAADLVVQGATSAPGQFRQAFRTAEVVDGRTRVRLSRTKVDTPGETLIFVTQRRYDGLP